MLGGSGPGPRGGGRPLTRNVSEFGSELGDLMLALTVDRCQGSASRAVRNRRRVVGKPDLCQKQNGSLCRWEIRSHKAVDLPK